MNESRESDQICKERNKRQEGLAVNLRIGIHSAKIKLVCVVFSLRLGIDPIRRGGGDYISPKSLLYRSTGYLRGGNRTMKSRR